jgi:hypothetical protein
MKEAGRQENSRNLTQVFLDGYSLTITVIAIHVPGFVYNLPEVESIKNNTV